MSWLLIDNSNTRTKFALGDAQGLGEWRRVLATAEVCTASLAALLEGVEFEAAVIASVVPSKAQVLREVLEARVPVHLLDHRSPLGMAIDYPQPEQIGADRLANAVGVRACHGVPAVVIDSGPAVTFDIVSAAPALSGAAHRVAAGNRAGRAGVGDWQVDGARDAGGGGDWVPRPGAGDFGADLR